MCSSNDSCYNNRTSVNEILYHVYYSLFKKELVLNVKARDPKESSDNQL